MGVDVSAETAEHVNEQTKSVLTNSVVLLSSKVVTWALAFVMTIMLPRYLGASSYGKLYFAISITNVFAIMVEFGLNSLVSREIAKKPESTTAYLVNAALLKVGLWVVAFAIMNAFVRIADYPPTTRLAVLILGAAIMITSMSSLLVAVLQATRHINWVAISSIAEKAVLTVLGVAALLAGYGMLVIAAIMLVSALVGLVLDLVWFAKLSRTAPVHEGWEGLTLKPLFVKALPFFSVVFLGAIYFRVDVIIMSLVKSSVVVGWYGASYRLFETTNLIPEAFMFAFFPVFCRMAVRGDNSLALATQKALDLLLLIGIPIAVGLFTLATPIVSTLYGAQFLPAAGSLRLLALATPFLYTNASFVQLLVATDRQKKLAMTAGVAAVVNVGLNLLLIPRYGHIGAAATTVVTEVVVTAVNYKFLPRGLTAELKWTTPAKAARRSGDHGRAARADARPERVPHDRRWCGRVLRLGRAAQGAASRGRPDDEGRHRGGVERMTSTRSIQPAAIDGIVCLSPDVWGEVKRPQQLMTRLASRAPVIYVEPAASFASALRHPVRELSASRSRWSRAMGGHADELAPGVHVVTPLAAVPPHYRGLLGDRGASGRRGAVRAPLARAARQRARSPSSASRRRRCGSPSPRRSTGSTRSLTRSSTTASTGGPISPAPLSDDSWHARVVRDEERLLASADVVFCSAEGLYAAKADVAHGRVSLLRNAADVAHFTPGGPALPCGCGEASRPGGRLHRRYRRVGRPRRSCATSPGCARAGRSCSSALRSPARSPATPRSSRCSTACRTSTSSAPAPTATFPRTSRRSTPRSSRSSSTGLPRTPTRSSSTSTWPAGKPVISTRLPEAATVEGVAIADDAAQFAAAIEAALSQPDADAVAHTARHRCEELVGGPRRRGVERAGRRGCRAALRARLHRARRAGARHGGHARRLHRRAAASRAPPGPYGEVGVVTDEVKSLAARPLPHVVWVGTDLPWPLDSGFRIRAFENLRALAEFASVTVVCLAEPPGIDDRAVELAAELPDTVRVLPPVAHDIHIRRDPAKLARAFFSGMSRGLPYKVAKFRSAAMEQALASALEGVHVDVVARRAGHRTLRRVRGVDRDGAVPSGARRTQHRVAAAARPLLEPVVRRAHPDRVRGSAPHPHVRARDSERGRSRLPDQRGGPRGHRVAYRQEPGSDVRRSAGGNAGPFG